MFGDLDVEIAKLRKVAALIEPLAPILEIVAKNPKLVEALSENIAEFAERIASAEDSDRRQAATEKAEADRIAAERAEHDRLAAEAAKAEAEHKRLEAEAASKAVEPHPTT